LIKAVKGTRDLLPPSTEVWNRVEAIARDVFRTYNYHEIRTPILEETQLFARGVGEETDIVTKEMYTFQDRDETSLTLRPENTASVIRAYIEHHLDQRPGVQKLYYIGPMFRRERPQKGRYRQFFQIGAEAIGSESPAVDAEVIEMVMELLARTGCAMPGCCSIRWATTIAARNTSNVCARNCKAWRPKCAAIASAARSPIRCACSIAKWKPTSRSSTSCPASSITSASHAAHISTP
jgi:histidyl-tRNA synthetase